MTLADVRKIAVPSACAAMVESHLRAAGRHGSEGMALWVGRQEGDLFRVLHTVIPEQTHLNTADGVCVIVKGDALHRLNVQLYRNGLTLLAQIHSHPGRAYHSSTDDAYAIATTVGCLSLVVPDFARAPFSIPLCATYRLDAAASWRPVSPRDAAAMIHIGD